MVMIFKKFNKKNVTIWALLSGFLLVATLLPTANALELSPSSVVAIDDSESVAVIELATAPKIPGETYASISGGIFSTDIALVTSISRQVEQARTPLGARKVAKNILLNEYGFNENEYNCLNSLWTKESNWNYKARNRSSGAHGIPQALPAIKMNVIATDWRTNPVTQIRWGLRYISIRYETPCKAWAKLKRSNYY